MPPRETAQVLEDLFRDWKEPRHATYKDAPSTMLFRCVAKEPCAGLIPLGLASPEDFMEFWSTTCGCLLFEDVTYGQWGLELFSPSESLRETERYRAERDDRGDPAETGDLIVGRFIGDLELLMVRCDAQQADYGAIVVVAEIDPRLDWLVAAPSFSAFLARYAQAQGSKYWESE